jgi:Ca-activated chloride channel family protein
MALEKRKGLSRIIVIATDGYVAVEKETFELIRKNLNQANIFAFGIGTGVNRYLIEGIARVGRGEPFVATSQEEAKKMAERFRRYIGHPILTDIEVRFEGFGAYDVEPLSLPDLFAQRPLILFGKYKNASGKIEVRGKTIEGDYRREIRVSSSLEDKDNIALRYLWAREKIARLADYGKVGVPVKEEVIRLGLKYHLMTEFTSFVAVDKIVRETGEVVTVKQPLPLPQGVSDYALPASAKIKHYGGYSGIVPRNMLTAREEMRGYDLKSAPAQIYVSGASLPPGITLNGIEKTILGQIKRDLEKTFKEWKLENLTIVLEVEKGKVKRVKIKEYQGKKCRQKTLERIFKRLRFPASLNGTLTLSLEYI